MSLNFLSDPLSIGLHCLGKVEKKRMGWKGRLFGLLVRFLKSEGSPVCWEFNSLSQMHSKSVIEVDKKDGDQNVACGLEISRCD